MEIEAAQIEHLREVGSPKGQSAIAAWPTPKAFELAAGEIAQFNHLLAALETRQDHNPLLAGEQHHTFTYMLRRLGARAQSRAQTARSGTRPGRWPAARVATGGALTSPPTWKRAIKRVRSSASRARA